MKGIDCRRVWPLSLAIVAAASAIYLIMSLSSAASAGTIGPAQTGSLSRTQGTRSARMPTDDVSAGDMAIGKPSPRFDSATCIVTSTADSGPGTLRQCLLDAQADDTIIFDPIVFNPATITLTSPLPKITTDGLTIDADGADVILNGNRPVLTHAHGLRIEADNVTISNLQIVNFDWSGVRVISGSENTLIKGNIVGGNGNHGIRIQGDQIAGTRILSNFLGTDASGMAASGNTLSGISIEEGSSNTLVRGNVIAANDDHGIRIVGVTTSNVVVSNSVGTNADGSLDLGNKLYGIVIRDGAQGNIIGPGNTIAYNGEDGIRVEGAATLRNTITRNSITANDKLGINNVSGGNDELAPPTILTVTDTTVQGKAQPWATIELFTDPFFEGQRFVASTTADASGSFTASLATSLTVSLVTATSTDVDGNTSQFAAFCRVEGLGSPDIIWPYCTTGPSSISSAFGPRLMASQGFRYDFHRGVDLPAPLETPFFAIADGVVTKVVTDPVGLDGTIRISHTDPVTYYSHYRHVAQSFVVSGQVVHTGGTPIGLTGHSASGFPHTHLETRDVSDEDESGRYEKYSVNPFGRMPYIDTNDYEIEISQVSVDPTDPVSPTTVWVRVTGPRQELDLNRFIASVDGGERVLDLNNLNRTQTPAPNNTEPDVLDNPYQNGICIMPDRFNTSSDAYRLNLVFHQMPGHPLHTITAEAADLFSNTVTTTLFASGGLLLTPSVVTATTPTGRWVTHVHTLTNASSMSQVYTLTVRSAQSWGVSVEPMTVALTSGESVTFTTTISVPSYDWVVTGTMDCVVVEVFSTVVPFFTYLPVVLKTSAASFEYDVQGCLAPTTTTNDWVEIYVEGDAIVMHHYDATYNCCAVIVVDFVDERPLLKLIERETYPGALPPCFCLCPYDINVRISDLLPGNYRVEVWNEDQSHRYGWAEVTI
jgi:murein DD-endopeptidase MepM/ murein hydrolase activator NlpD